jgi:hypothetical protein
VVNQEKVSRGRIVEGGRDSSGGVKSLGMERWSTASFHLKVRALKQRNNKSNVVMIKEQVVTEDDKGGTGRVVRDLKQRKARGLFVPALYVFEHIS